MFFFHVTPHWPASSPKQYMTELKMSQLPIKDHANFHIYPLLYLYPVRRNPHLTNKIKAGLKIQR